MRGSMPARYIQRHRKLNVRFVDKIVSLQNSFNKIRKRCVCHSKRVVKSDQFITHWPKQDTLPPEISGFYFTPIFGENELQVIVQVGSHMISRYSGRVMLI